MIYRENNTTIKVEDENGKYIKSQSVEANILFEILEELESIKGNQIDIEEEIKSLKEVTMNQNLPTR